MFHTPFSSYPSAPWTAYGQERFSKPCRGYEHLMRARAIRTLVSSSAHIIPCGACPASIPQCMRDPRGHPASAHTSTGMSCPGNARAAPDLEHLVGPLEEEANHHRDAPVDEPGDGEGSHGWHSVLAGLDVHAHTGSCSVVFVHSQPSHEGLMSLYTALCASFFVFGLVSSCHS